MLPTLEPEGARHAATAGIEQMNIESKPFQDFLFRLRTEDGAMMAMQMHQGFAVQLSSGIIRREFAEELAQQEGLLAQPARVDIGREKVFQFIAKNGGATRLQHDHGRAGFDLGPEGFEDLPQSLFRFIEQAVIVERPAAAQMRLGHLNAETGVFEHFDGRLGDIRMKVVVERVRPEQDWRFALVASRASLEPNLEWLGRKEWNFSLGCDPREPFARAAEQGLLGKPVGGARRETGETRPVMNQSEGVGVARPEPASVVMRQKLRLVSRDIHVHRAIAFATFAREAQIERFLHFFVVPAIADRVALKHLEQQMRAPASAVHFLARHHVTRTHRAAAVPATFPHADAALGRAPETKTVIHEFEMRLRLVRMVMRAEAQVFVNPMRPDDFAGIHFPVRVPERFELLEGADQLGTEELWQELGARLSIAMLAGKGAAVLHNEVGGLIQEGAKLFDA